MIWLGMAIVTGAISVLWTITLMGQRTWNDGFYQTPTSHAPIEK
jgi:hypothetical protein